MMLENKQFKNINLLLTLKTLFWKRANIKKEERNIQNLNSTVISLNISRKFVFTRKYYIKKLKNPSKNSTRQYWFQCNKRKIIFTKLSKKTSTITVDSH
jgi:hypothetical protein